jgi:hypothetical protein
MLDTYAGTSGSSVAFPFFTPWTLALFTSASSSGVDPALATGALPAGAASVANEVSGGSYARFTPLSFAAATTANPAAKASNTLIQFAAATADWANGTSLWVNGWGIYDTHATPASRVGLWHGPLNVGKAVLTLDVVEITSGNLILQIDPTT